jgi:hypothetical protein
MIRGLGEALEAALRFLAAMPAALLPKRHWPDLEAHVPVVRAVFASSLATFVLAFVIGVPGFFRHAEGSSRLAIRTMLEETGWRQPSDGAAIPARGAGTTMWGVAYLSAFSFAFLTPAGWLSMYLAFTGFYRMIGVYTDDLRGDPILGVIDAAWHRATTRRRARGAVTAREALEGDEVADRLVLGRTAGLDAAEFVVIASRRKPGWKKGVFVITPDKWYRIGTPVDRDTPNGLRTLYPLNEIKDQEAFRNGVHYELPPLSGARE